MQIAFNLLSLPFSPKLITNENCFYIFLWNLFQGKHKRTYSKLLCFGFLCKSELIFFLIIWDGRSTLNTILNMHPNPENFYPNILLLYIMSEHSNYFFLLLPKINNKHKQHITQQYHIFNFSYNTTMQLRLPNDLFFIKCLKKYLLKELNIIMLY
jgi:hypothetical protein